MLAKRPSNEKVNPSSSNEPKTEPTTRAGKVIVDPTLSCDREGDKGGDLEMIKDNFSDSGDNFDVLCNMVSILLVECDVVMEVMNAEEEFFAEELADHKLVCYYVMNNNYVNEQNFVFEKPHLGMKSHLKPLLIKAKVDNYGVNKVLVDIGAIVNLMPHSLLSKMGKFDTDLKPPSMVLSKYKGKTDHSLGEIQVDLAVRTTIRPTLFMVVPSKDNYNMLLGREWIHGVCAVPSSLY